MAKTNYYMTITKRKDGVLKFHSTASLTAAKNAAKGKELVSIDERTWDGKIIRTHFSAAPARRVSIRTVSDQGRHAGVKKLSTRVSKPKRSGRDMGGDVVQERGRRHLRLW